MLFSTSYLSCVKIPELHRPAKTEHKLALGGWHSANTLVLYLNMFKHIFKLYRNKSSRDAFPMLLFLYQNFMKTMFF